MGQERHKSRLDGRAALAQEAKQERREAARGGGAASAALQEDGTETAPWVIDPDLVDDYLSVPFISTVPSILFSHDPRYNMMGIEKGIKHGGYRRALEMLLKDPPPRSPSGSRIEDNRARMLERLGRYEEAEALYRDLVEEEPNQPQAHLDMARVLEHLGRREESARELARASRFIPDYRLAFEAGMHPDPRQLDPARVPLRLIVPMSVIAAAGTVRSRAELSAASLLVQAECGLDLYAPAGSRLPGCAGLGADMERFHHLVVEDVISYCDLDELPYYYDLTDRGIEMIGSLGERLDRAVGEEGADAASRIAASARRVAGIGAHAVLEEACGAAATAAHPASAAVGRGGGGRDEALVGLRGTAERIRQEVRNSIGFGAEHAVTLRSTAVYVIDMLSQAKGATDRQWSVAAALGADVLGLCARVAFDQRPHPRSPSLGPPYPDIQDLCALFVRYCADRGLAELGEERVVIGTLTDEEVEETARDMLKVISESC